LHNTQLVGYAPSDLICGLEWCVLAHRKRKFRRFIIDKACNVKLMHFLKLINNSRQFLETNVKMMRLIAYR
jgi:hypothetical protein